MPEPAALQGFASCHTCGKVSLLSSDPAEETARCPRCRTPLHLRKPYSLQRTWALLLAAGTLYVPANLLPIMEVSGIQGAQNSTILSGVVTFWQMGSYPVAIIIFTASVLIPLMKVAALVWLCLAAQGYTDSQPRALNRVYRITELLGRWSMVDVFVVAVLATLVKLGALMTITPGPAAISFAGVVILTMFAAMSFDPRLIWDRHRESFLNSKGDDPAAGDHASAPAEKEITTPSRAPQSP
ncbi:MAG: paraquat-inducible membrane protein A [Verrucomicrobiaceae bacterium]|nr:MAG: paraquat-inducible membrane protein A [Verrucomicrobiaceae bacterium]